MHGDQMKVSRNELCPCGSGKKFKKCCLNSSQTNCRVGKQNHSQAIQSALREILEHDEGMRTKAKVFLRTLLDSEKLNDNDRVNASLGLISAHQRLGEHNEAILQIEAFQSNSPAHSDLNAHLKHSLAISYCSLGRLPEACTLFDQVIDYFNSKTSRNETEERVFGSFLLEAGKVYRSAGENFKARTSWERALSLLEKHAKTELEQLERVKANLAMCLLEDGDPKIRQQALKQLEASVQNKLRIGDLQGAANSYCNLGNYYQKIKRYERAIAYFRKDLYFCRIVGNKRDTATTLGNLATLYADLKQFTQARAMLKEAWAIGEELNDSHLSLITESQLKLVNLLAKESGQKGILIGAKALCACESGRKYSECCGKADHEPIDIPYALGGISEDAKKVYEELKASGKQSSPLDFIIRQIDPDKIRFSWANIEHHDGWLKLSELPDMGSIHLASAQGLASPKGDAGQLSRALGAIILSVCFLEAFINQVAFFLYETQTHPSKKDFKIPEELKKDGPLLYQRGTNLETKWEALSEALIGQDWLSNMQPWVDAKNLIYLRNELVHFKSEGYEEIIPPPKLRPKIYSKVPSTAIDEEILHGWPIRIINTKTAAWAIETAKSLVNAFINDFNLRRRSGINSAKHQSD